MKYFDRDGKHNFVDVNNVFVGYDSGQSCCEDADWVIRSKIAVSSEDFIDDTGKTNRTDDLLIDEYNLEDYNFDTSFFKQIDSTDFSSLDDGGVAIFKMVNSKGEELFLHLYNIHNGYYGHGFDMTADGETLFEGCL